MQNETQQICYTKDGLYGKPCPANGKVDHSQNGAIKKTCEIASAAGCENARIFLEKNFMSLYCTVKLERV